MELLSYRTLGAEASLSRRMPERVLQFGDGNFLRGFVDDFIDQMNEKADFDSSVVIVPPASTGKTGRINRQDGLYQLYLRGKLNGQVVDQRRLIRCISRALDVFTQWQELPDFVCGDELRFVISNTTEAGIVYDSACRFDDCPPASFPAKLTRLLWQRWYAGKPGLILLPCELIADNGTVLRDTVLRHAADWALEEDFLHWLREENHFCNTLVDRIVTGYPAAQASRLNAENGYEDALLDTAEPFGLWVIEGGEALSREFPAQLAGFPVTASSLREVARLWLWTQSPTWMAWAVWASAMRSGSSPTVGCVNSVAEPLAREVSHDIRGSVTGVYAWPHPYGCSQAGDDQEHTRQTLCDLIRHPNAGGVLMLGRGCENSSIGELKKLLGDWDPERTAFLECQSVPDELEAGRVLLRLLVDHAAKDVRCSIPASELVIGLKCGGSDGLSDITANPLVGHIADWLVSMGGSALPAELPALVADFKEYFVRHGQVVYENPSPGNKAGGITTLEEKLECVYVPMLMGAAQTAEELSESATARGIEHPGKMSSWRPIGFHVQDAAMTLLFLALCVGGICCKGVLP